MDTPTHPLVKRYRDGTLERLHEADFLDDPHCVLRLRDMRVTGEGRSRLTQRPGAEYFVLSAVRVPVRRIA